MESPGRVWRTVDDELVGEGHPDAAFLLYAKGDEVEKRDQKAVAALFAEAPADDPAPEPDTAVKQQEKPQDKQAAAPANK